MKAAIPLVLILALAGCNKAPKRHAQPAEAANTVEAAPASVPLAYERFPVEVRALIYQWDTLNERCGNKFRQRDEAACKGREALSAELLKKGWCFGGADDLDKQHWVLCAEDYPGGASWVAGEKAAEEPAPDQ